MLSFLAARNLHCVSSNFCDNNKTSPCEYPGVSPAFAGSESYLMKADLIQAASEIIPNSQILVNVISRRVRQLTFGHRPLVHVPPGTGAADISLMEVIGKKLTYEPTLGQKDAVAPVVPFPGRTALTKKAA